MARIRTVKPGFWTDEDLCKLSIETHVLAAGLLNYSDDEGFFNANPKLVHAAVFPLRELSQKIHGMLMELSKSGYLKLFTGTDGKSYGRICNFLKHQVVSRPSPSKIKTLQQSEKTHGALMESSALKGMEGNKEEEGNGSETPDSLMQAVATELRVTDRWQKVSCSEQIKLAMLAGEPGKAIAERMIESGHKYRAGPDFKFGGWKKFFADGLWSQNGTESQYDRVIAEANKQLADN